MIPKYVDSLSKVAKVGSPITQAEHLEKMKEKFKSIRSVFHKQDISQISNEFASLYLNWSNRKRVDLVLMRSIVSIKKSNIISLS